MWVLRGEGGGGRPLGASRVLDLSPPFPHPLLQGTHSTIIHEQGVPSLCCRGVDLPCCVVTACGSLRVRCVTLHARRHGADHTYNGDITN